MKRFLAVVLTLAFSAALCGAAPAEKRVPSPAWAQHIAELIGCDQLAVVAGLSGSCAVFSLHERDEEGGWYVVLSANAYIGENGLGKQVVGDKKTPVGVFTLDFPFGIEEDPGSRLPYHRVTEYDYWSGDYYHYNQLVDIRDYPALNTAASEHLIDIEPQYHYCMNIGYNPEGDVDAGAAIFLHCIKPEKTYTAGCVAIPEEDMVTVLRHVGEGCPIVIDSLERLLRYG